MIDSFSGDYRFLSNFYPSPMVIPFPGLGSILVPTVEHPYQALKCDNVEDAKTILKQRTPGQTKRLIKSMDHINNFHDYKYDFMKALVTEKFNQNLDLAKKLVETGDRELVEGNTWGDVYWGVCRGVGENNLGKILMNIRSTL